MIPENHHLQELPPSLLLLYAQLLEEVGNPLLPIEHTTFLQRHIGGKTYWIRRVQLGGTRMDLSLGRETTELLDAIEKTRLKITEAKKESEGREHLIKMLISGGANAIDPLSGKILTLLEGAGVFAAGGVLVGSHAFNAYGNMLGYKFPLETARTADIDLSISIGVTRQITDLKTAILESNLGFFEVPALQRKSPSTSYKIRGKEFKIDLLTPLSGPDSARPVYIGALKTFAFPLRFLDYLIKDPIQAVVVSGRGVLVNLPQPSRFAIHKLVLAQRRQVTEQIKSIKDLHQAAYILEILSKDRPADLYSPLLDVKRGRSRKFEQQMFQGLEQAYRRKLLAKDTFDYFNESWKNLRDNTE